MCLQYFSCIWDSNKGVIPGGGGGLNNAKAILGGSFGGDNRGNKVRAFGLSIFGKMLGKIHCSLKGLVSGPFGLSPGKEMMCPTHGSWGPGSQKKT